LFPHHWRMRRFQMVPAAFTVRRKSTIYNPQIYNRHTSPILINPIIHCSYMKVRLQKAIADSGLCSRRKAESLIIEGLVTVNGRTAKLGESVNSDVDTIEVNGKPISSKAKVYYILNKPPGYECTLDSTTGNKLVTELIPTSVRIFPVGRLDMESRGLLILTNDGDFANRVIHPSSSVEKEYLVSVSGKLKETALEQLRAGIMLDGTPTKPCRVEIVQIDKSGTIMSFIIHEGRKRQIRRMLESLGFIVTDLKRVRVGGITLGDLKEGRSRKLTKNEIHSLNMLRLDAATLRSADERR